MPLCLSSVPACECAHLVVPALVLSEITEPRTIEIPEYGQLAVLVTVGPTESVITI